eukprot:scaffold29074_cov63-Phaeocystis_antarctica.AAC.2
MARPESRYGVEIRSPVQYSGSVASPAGTHTAACACMRVRVRACARARARVCTAPLAWDAEPRMRQVGRPFQSSHCGGEPSKSSSVSSCSSSSISSSPPSS